jgi:hypothetical protein
MVVAVCEVGHTGKNWKYDKKNKNGPGLFQKYSLNLSS